MVDGDSNGKFDEEPIEFNWNRLVVREFLLKLFPNCSGPS